MTIVIDRDVACQNQRQRDRGRTRAAPCPLHVFVGIKTQSPPIMIAGNSVSLGALWLMAFFFFAPEPDSTGSFLHEHRHVHPRRPRLARTAVGDVFEKVLERRGNTSGLRRSGPKREVAVRPPLRFRVPS